MQENGKGGANTNLHGLKFEKDTDLAASVARDLDYTYRLVPHQFKHPHDLPVNSSNLVYDVFRIRDDRLIGTITKQVQFYNVLYEHYGLINYNQKKWKPDECFFNYKTNTIFIIEKKFQKTAGSVDEKIFSFGNKRRLYVNDFNQLSKEPKPTVEFAALFNSSWWLQGNHGQNGTTYQDYFNSLRLDGIKLFFDNYEYWWFGL